MNKHILHSFFGFLALIMITGCQDNELGNPLPSTVSNFSYTMTNSGYFPCDVEFTNLSINAEGYLWNFGNGETSTLKDPVVSFDSIGIYTVTLTCTAVNNVHYNQLVKTMLINVKDPNAGLTQVLYFTSRNPNGGGVHMIILDDNAPIVQDFDFVEFYRPYGIAVDTSSRKVYVADFNMDYIYNFDADGKNPLKILDITVPGQELAENAEGMMVISDKIYWGKVGGICRANRDGTMPELFINTGTLKPEYPIDFHYDKSAEKIYFVNDREDYSGGLFSVNFDGTVMTEIIPDIDGTAIELDTETGKIYLAVYGVTGSAITENGIYMCNTDGSSLNKIGDFGAKATWGMTIDHEHDKLFWSYKETNSDPDGKIIRANLDGSAQEDWVTGVSPHAMEIVWIKL